jgi:hypothetical protein
MLPTVNQRGSFFNSRQSSSFDGTLVFEQAERTSLGAQWFSVEHSQAEPDLPARTTFSCKLMDATGVCWKPIYYMLEDGFELLLVNCGPQKFCDTQAARVM